MFKKIYTLIAVSLLFIVVGCASLTTGSDAGDEMLTIYATAKFIDKGSSEAEQTERAQSIYDTVQDIRQIVSLNSYSLGDLGPVIKKRIDEKYDLSPADRYLAFGLIDNIILSLEQRLVDGVPIPIENQTFRINQVLDWVESATGFYLL
jgi:hypothetical protein